MTIWFFVCLFCLLSAKDGTVLTIDSEEYSLQQFYAHFSKKQWEGADSSKRVEIFTDFIKRKLCVLEAKKLGLENNPDIAIKIRDLSHRLLVNESYEQLVAWPLIDLDDIEDSRMFAKNELLISHILIGFAGASLAHQPKRSLDDAFVLAQNIKNQFLSGEDFSKLAEKYSDDPGVGQNAGIVGWVSWGLTVPEFQSAAFRLEVGLLSDPVLTAYGYHLILVTDSRPSDYQYMSDEEYQNVIMNISKKSIRNKLRGAAISYDSLQIEKHGVYFNSDAIRKIIQAYQHKLKETSIKGTENINAADFLESASDIGVVCVFDGAGFGPRWFANKIRRISASRQPLLNSGEIIISVFKTIVLQDLAVKNGYLFDVDNSFSFRWKKTALVSDLLYDAYLKYLIKHTPVPDTANVQEYYNKNLVEKYMKPESVLIREIRVSSRALADSLFGLIDNGDSFALFAKTYSSINPETGGLCEPFSRNKDQALFDAAMILEPGKISPVLSLRGNQFSIILLEKKIAGTPLDFSSIYSNIESRLTREWQDAAKNKGVDGLFDKYNIQRHINLLE